MEKQKRWQLFLILAVILLTVYNILPTVFYYANPLKQPIGEKEAQKIASEVVGRVDSLESFTVSWLKAFSKNLGFSPESILLDPQNPRLAKITFKKPEHAALFAQVLPRAGALIPFVPAQLSLDPRIQDADSKTLYVQRKIGIHMDPSETARFFRYIPKFTPTGDISPLYREIITDRVVQIALGLGGESEPAKILSFLVQNAGDDRLNEGVIRLARQIVDFENAFGDSSPITARFFASFTQTDIPAANRGTWLSQLSARFEKTSQQIGSKIQELKQSQAELREKGSFLSPEETQRLELLGSQKSLLDSASSIVRRNAALFEKGSLPLTASALQSQIKGSEGSKVTLLEIGDRNPFINRLAIHWDTEEISILLHPEVEAIRQKQIGSESDALQVETLNQLLFNAVAKVARSTDETISPSVSGFTVKLTNLTNSQSLLTLDIAEIANATTQTLATLLKSAWIPESKELSLQNFPFLTQSASNIGEKKLGLWVYAPIVEKNPQSGFRPGSLYVVARGMGSLLQKYKELPASSEKTAFENSFRSLQELMRLNGFIGYYGADSGLPATHKNDFIFELDDYYSYIIAASREDFSVKGSKRFAVLELTDVEQRLMTVNKIETRMHEDLIKWRDEYHAAQVSLNPRARLEVPPPTRNVFLDNFLLSARKYFRGDERKILKWGLDLSGGKTVRIGLKDQNNQPITAEDDLKQAVNELYQRVNKLGVSEVSIRTEGSSIVIDFPGSQGLSASELIQASAMYFHVVNEKFNTSNPELSDAVNTFLEEVWNEAVITNRTDPESLNEIAWQHLGGNSEHPEEFQPLTSHARILVENGLRLAGSKAAPRSSVFNDTLSSVAAFRGDDFADWQGQTNPLVIIFRNYALEGSNLSDVQTGYDPSEGNILLFGVKGSAVTRDGRRLNPREDFYNWTSAFSEEKIAGTPKEAFTGGRGWRMAVILNGSVISAPTLTSALKDSARISGHFSQREVNQLAADLKAGSLSFTPQILSEENVSPDLGKEQRVQGIFAAALGLVLVIIVMISYYRFGGVIASIAVLFNLLILWGVLQNLGAALTLPGIAGIILTIGMSVDANVLVFERIREEFEISNRLPSAVQAGYRKAFSAIVDSNLTTIIAALILLNFDSGPIKGFALTLIIGIVSSMFTSLFMTRYFFAGWVQNPEHKTLSMAKFFGKTHFNFLSKAKTAFVLTAVILAIGLGLFFVQKKTIFGMDFTGGYALTVDLKEKPATNYRLEATKALESAGAGPSDFQIRELNKPYQLRIQLGMGMEQPGKPFYRIDETPLEEPTLFLYQQNPRMTWIVDTLQSKGLEIQPASLAQLQLHWTEMSGQLSDSMRNNALIGLGLALLCILIYITFRFEFKYAISATLALAHDLLITIGILAILHLFFESIQIDLQVIGALMTIVGYSLNDTIIIFDRIREDLRIMRKQSFSEIINHALNATLSRTMMTSGTTIIVLLALTAFGGKTIFNFSLIMTIGVAVGTLSSLFIASPFCSFSIIVRLQKDKRTLAPCIKSLSES